MYTLFLQHQSQRNVPNASHTMTILECAHHIAAPKYRTSPERAAVRTFQLWLHQSIRVTTHTQTYTNIKTYTHTHTHTRPNLSIHVSHTHTTCNNATTSATASDHPPTITTQPLRRNALSTLCVAADRQCPDFASGGQRDSGGAEGEDSTAIRRACMLPARCRAFARGPVTDRNCHTCCGGVCVCVCGGAPDQALSQRLIYSAKELMNTCTLEDCKRQPHQRLLRHAARASYALTQRYPVW